MPESHPEKTQSSIDDLLKQYGALVHRYADTLDLSSPSLLERFEAAIRNTEAYDVFLETGQIVLDIGSGVGLPGIPIAIRRPDLRIALCEIRKRRAAFLERAVSVLSLKNARVYNSDVKQLTGHQYDVVIAQAVGQLKDIYRMSEHILRPEWTILTRKGADLKTELEELQVITGEVRFKTQLLEDGTMLVAAYGGAV